MNTTLTERCTGLAMQTTDCGQVYHPPNQEGVYELAHKWRCTLRYEGRRLTTDFYVGLSASGPPMKERVVGALLDDAAVYDAAESYEDWCYSLGMSPRERQSRHDHTAVQKQTDRLKTLLGPEFEAWLYETDHR